MAFYRDRYDTGAVGCGRAPHPTVLPRLLSRGGPSKVNVRDGRRAAGRRSAGLGRRLTDGFWVPSQKSGHTRRAYASAKPLPNPALRRSA
jgi:hypothetical protein